MESAQEQAAGHGHQLHPQAAGRHYERLGERHDTGVLQEVGGVYAQEARGSH